MGQSEFSVFQFLTGGMQERVRHFVTAEEAVAAAMHYTNNVATKMGIVERVIITDGGDCTVFEWLKGQGIVYPESMCDTHKIDIPQDEKQRKLNERRK